MKKHIQIGCLIGFSALLSVGAMARDKEDGGGSQKPTTGNNENATKAANCAPAGNKETLEFNDVSALIEADGALWQDRQNGVPAYEVPKGSGTCVIFAGGIWMGGLDVNGQLKLAAVRFKQDGQDYWPGPLTVDQNAPGVNYDPSAPVGDDAVRPYGEANIEPEDCAAYDKFFPMTKSAVVSYTIWWEACNGPLADPVMCEDVPVPNNEDLAAIYEWPAHGDVSKGQDYFLAPFYDRNGNNTYEPDLGETPWYDDILGRDDIECGIDRRISLFGDNTIWWVFNDKGNIHTESNGSDPIGMEIHAQAFAFGTSDEINRMTFYNYEMINRGTQTLENTYFAQYVDPDVGGAADDYVGCDVSRGLGYAYNGDNEDLTVGSSQGYGENPPAVGVDFFEGPYQDADGIDNPGPQYNDSTQTWEGPTVAEALAQDGIVYNGIGIGYGDGIIDNERFGMRVFSYYTNAAVFPYSDPNQPNQHYNFLEGKWADGSNMYYGGNGQTGTILTSYAFPGDSDSLNWATGGVDPGYDWSEESAGTDWGDRRFVQSAGPFTLKPGAVNNLTVGVVYGRSFEGDAFASVNVMKAADTKAQALFDACFDLLAPPNAPQLTIQELENEVILMLDNPGGNNMGEDYEEIDDINIPITFADRAYRFEGYQIYQLVDEDASVADITDNSKARLVAQCDIENDVDRLVNYEFNEELGADIPREAADGENKGIRHTFKITEDEFAQGDDRLVNHKKYYYIAVAYAHNEYKEYDPNDSDKLDGQKLPYISSNLSFDGSGVESVEAIPHHPMPEAGGTFHHVEYGTTPKITRLDGHGNGGRHLELTENSKDVILANGRMADPTYENNRGPIDVKVVDPLNVTGGYYELKFHSYDPIFNENAADTASWTVYRYESEGGAFIDSVASEEMINSQNEQIVPEWGVSISVFQEPYLPSQDGNAGVDLKTEPIDHSIHYSDSSQIWLDFITDNDVFQPTNWVRSGSYDPEDPEDCLPTADPWNNPCNYPDEKLDEEKVFAKLIDGGVAPHKLVGYQADFMPLAYSNSFFQNPRNTASLSYLPSVDIVITSDKSKWTRCPVIELGHDANLNIGGAEAGEMRKSQSVDKNGNPDGSGTGMGWFPGYAIDLESGARLHLAFGENSFLGADNGGDMLWNPTSRLFDASFTPVLGGQHPIWVFGVDSKDINNPSSGVLKNMQNYNPFDVNNNFLQQQMAIAEDPSSGGAVLGDANYTVYGNLYWIVNPVLAESQDLLACDVTMKLRVNKTYKNYNTTGQNNGRPMYSWNMDEIATNVDEENALAEALEMINVVPNPYYAFSEYERSRLDTRVKITNLPEICNVKIYTTNGRLVRSFKKDSPITSLDWDLNNSEFIPVASGVYLIHVEVPGIGERVLKFFAGVRQVDLQGI